MFCELKRGITHVERAVDVRGIDIHQSIGPVDFRHTGDDLHGYLCPWSVFTVQDGFVMLA
jgi:hypothetical protein